MNFLDHKTSFDSLMGVKSMPNEREKALLRRAEKYIRKISWIPGLRMVSVVNSVSMYATHKDSDIDLFIVTSRGTMWSVRVMVTLVFWLHGVWRHGEDIAGNFCLSFFVTEDAMDLSKIAIEDDIYLYYWIYYMKPILVVGDMWERFQMTNDKGQMTNEKGEMTQRGSWKVPIQKAQKSYFEIFAKILDICIRPFGKWRAMYSYEKKGRPTGVIITPDMLKFHDEDRRQFIRESILG